VDGASVAGTAPDAAAGAEPEAEVVTSAPELGGATGTEADTDAAADAAAEATVAVGTEADAVGTATGVVAG
jgi:hypothetical protein